MKLEDIENIDKFREGMLSFMLDISKLIPTQKLGINNFIDSFINKWGDQVKKITDNKTFVDSGIGTYMALFVHTLEVANFISSDSDTGSITKKSITDGTKMNETCDYYFPPLTRIRFSVLWEACKPYDKILIASKINDLYLHSWPIVFEVGMEKFSITQYIKYYDTKSTLDDYSKKSKEFVTKNIADKGTKINKVFDYLLDELLKEMKNKGMEPGKILEVGIDKLGNIIVEIIENAKKKLDEFNLTPKDMKELEEKLQSSSKKNSEMMLVMMVFNTIKSHANSKKDQPMIKKK